MNALISPEQILNAHLREEPAVEIFGAQATMDYEIDQDPIVYGLLSDTVYSTPPLAVVREYLTNAWDSHKEAGKTDVPVEIILESDPPRLVIRDYGVGLDFEDMNRIFRFYFRSTKRGQDLMTGTFGIGSKVAFAFVDQFTATSWKDGHKHVFANFLQPNRRPSYAVMTPAPQGLPSDEPTGVAIDIPILDAADVKRFRQHAENVIKVSAINAKLIVDGVDVTPENSFGRALAVHGFGYITATLDGHYSGQSPFVVQGEIAYPARPLLEKAKSDVFPATRDLYLHAPSRTFEYPLSRETLRQTQRAEAKIAEMLAAVDTQIAAAYVQILTDAVDRMPIARLAAVLDNATERSALFKALAGSDPKPDAFCGPRGAALHLGATGNDGRYLPEACRRAAERRFRRRFKTAALARAAIRRSLDREFGRIAASVLAANRASPTQAPALCLYRRSYDAHVPESKFSRALVHTAAEKGPFLGYRILDDNKQEEPETAKSIAAKARDIADTLVERTLAGEISLIVRPTRLRTLFFNSAGPSHRDVPVQFSTSGHADPLDAVDPALALALMRATGRSRIVADRMEHMAGRPKPVRRPRETIVDGPAPAPTGPRRIICTMSGASYHRYGNRRIPLGFADRRPEHAPIAFITVTASAAKSGSFTTPLICRDLAEPVINLISSLLRLHPDLIAVAGGRLEAEAFARAGLAPIPLEFQPPWDATAPLPDFGLIGLAGRLLALHSAERALLHSHHTDTLIVKTYLADQRRRFGRNLIDEVRQHAADLVRLIISREGIGPALKAQREAWEVFAARYPLLGPKWSSDESVATALRHYFDLVDAHAGPEQLHSANPEPVQ